MNYVSVPPKYTNSCVVCDIILKISNDYEWKLIVNGHAVDGPVIADILEVLNQDNTLVLYKFLWKIVFCKGNTDFPDILERHIEIKEQGLSKERLALVESSLGKTTLMKWNFDTVRHPECLPNQKYVANVGNYGKIYFPSKVNHPEKHRKSS